MATKLLIAIAVLVGLGVILVALQPAAFSVERSLVIAGSGESIYLNIASLRAMDVWSPWEKMDPKLETKYEGPESGVGARSSWKGPEMGKGRLEITQADPPRALDLELTMI